MSSLIIRIPLSQPSAMGNEVGLLNIPVFLKDCSQVGTPCASVLTALQWVVGRVYKTLLRYNGVNRFGQFSHKGEIPEAFCLLTQHQRALRVL